jgi:flagellar basal body-associated protein FliL
MMMAKPVKPKALKPKTGAPSGGNEAADEVNTHEASSPEASGSPNRKKTSSPSSGESLTMLQTIILAAVMLVSSIVGPMAALYFLGPTIIKPLIAQAQPAEGEAPAGEEGHGGGESGEGHGGEHGAHGGAGGHGEASASQVGMTLKFEDFTINLKKDPTLRGNQYLSAKMSVSVQVPKDKDCLTPLIAPAEGEHGAAHAEGGGGGHGESAPAGSPLETCQKGFQEAMTPFVPTLRDIVNTAFMKRTATQVASVDGQESLKDEITTEMNSVLTNSNYNVLRVNFENFVVQR